MRKEDSHRLTYIYFIMSVMIVALHVVDAQFYQPNRIASIVYSFSRVVCNMAVPAFFFLSAFLLFRTITTKTYLTLLKRKVKTLVVPYLLWNIILMLAQNVKFILRGGHIQEDFFAVCRKIVMSDYNSVLWFVRVVVVFVLLSKIIEQLLKNKRLFWIVTGASFVINITLTYNIGYSHFYYWLPVYLLGAYLGYYHENEFFSLPRKDKNYLLVMLMAGMLFLLLCMIGLIDNRCLYIARCGTPILMWILSDIMKRADREPPWWCHISFFIYCSQLLLCSVIRGIYIRVLGNGSIQLLAAVVITTTALVFVQILVAYIMKRYLPILWRVLTGTR